MHYQWGLLYILFCLRPGVCVWVVGGGRCVSSIMHASDWLCGWEWQWERTMPLGGGLLRVPALCRLMVRLLSKLRMQVFWWGWALFRRLRWVFAISQASFLVCSETRFCFIFFFFFPFFFFFLTAAARSSHPGSRFNLLSKVIVFGSRQRQTKKSRLPRHEQPEPKLRNGKLATEIKVYIFWHTLFFFFYCQRWKMDKNIVH